MSSIHTGDLIKKPTLNNPTGVDMSEKKSDHIFNLKTRHSLNDIENTHLLPAEFEDDKIAYLLS